MTNHNPQQDDRNQNERNPGSAGNHQPQPGQNDRQSGQGKPGEKPGNKDYSHDDAARKK